MLNLQIRGFHASIKVNSLITNEKELLVDNIRSTKRTLAEVLLNTNEYSFKNIGNYSLPIITNNSELIATSFSKKNYYDEGFSFFREKIHKLADKASSLKNKIKLNNYGLMTYTTFYGCTFESEIEKVNYKNFDINNVDIETIKFPLIKQKFIKNIFFNNTMLTNLNRSKSQPVKFKSILYKATNNKIPLNKNSKSSIENEIIIYSEKNIKNEN